MAESFDKHLNRYIKNNNPEIIVFGGGLSVLNAAIINKLAKRHKNTTIYVTKFGDNCGTMGGFGLIKRGLDA